MFKKLYLLIPIIPKLGYYNVAYMVWYRLSMKMGWRKRKFPIGDPVRGPFYRAVEPIDNYPKEWRKETLDRANRILEGELTWFHYHRMRVGNPPNWFQNPFDGSVLKNPRKHWTELGDFDLNTGDIKILWEPSRFDWLTDLARAYRITGDAKYLDTINTWLKDWSAHNPLNQGPNWKCGQETSIRVMKLITVAQILNQDKKALLSLVEMIHQHVERVKDNITYAIVQNNNHGTSEGAGLYIGAVWLLNQYINSKEKQQYKKWKERGRKILENRILHLIAPQGTFAQKSVNYHRVVVDTMSWVLYAMERYDEPEFSQLILNRLEKLGEWQVKMISSPQGDVPNIGANDGAMLETLHNRDYRDFRPSTQLFFGVLKRCRIFQDKDVDEPLFWRYPMKHGSMPVQPIPHKPAEIMDDQFLILQNGETKIFVKIPSDRFRPSSSDAFHLDLWHKGENLLGDSGSYSYNAGEETNWYKSIAAHNTIQFGTNEQMPKISRFLYGHWLQAKTIEPLRMLNEIIHWSGQYSDHLGNVHRRSIEWNTQSNSITITDEVSALDGETTFYWNRNVNSESHPMITVKAVDGTVLSPEKVPSSHSLYYLQKEDRCTLKFKVRDQKIMTTIRL